MSPTKSQPEPTRPGSAPAGPTSRALEWLWQHLRDVPHPHILDCGPACHATLSVLLRRKAKVYVADVVAPVQSGDPAYWSRTGKSTVFLTEKFLGEIPNIPPESLSSVFCWHLLDLLPREALPAVVERLCFFLQPGGALFCLLREPNLAVGVETRWWLESLTVLGSGTESRQPFSYPALSNREMERLIPGGNVKTFLTRAGRREVLAIK